MWGGGGRRRDGVGEEWGWGVVGSLYSAEKLPERCHLAASNNEGHFPNQRELAGSHGFFKDLVHYGLWHYLCVNSDRQPYPEGNLNGLCFSPHLPISLPAYNPHASLAICTAKSKTEGSKKRHDTRQILRCKWVSVSRSRSNAGGENFFSSACIYSWVQTEILATVNVHALLSVHVCASRFFLCIYVWHCECTT